MESDNKDRGSAAAWLEVLSDEKMSLIDFDRLREWLASMGTQMDHLDKCRSDLDMLRDDLVSRIGGMVKAIAIADRKGARLESALAYAESLTSLGAKDLLEQYRRVSACFRDAFPLSYGLGPGTGGKTRGAKDLSVFK